MIETVDDLTIETIDDLVVPGFADLDDESYDELVIETFEDLDGLAVDGLAVDEFQVADADEDTPDDFEFSVVWPDGTEEPAARVTRHADEPVIDADPLFTQSDDGYLEFTMPPLELGDEADFVDADVPDDVAEAVRRAIAAIESATDATVDFVPQSGSTAPAPQSFGGFAPPTMATRAEVLYGQMHDDGSPVSDASPTVARATSSPSAASAPGLYADETADDEGSSGGGNERSSALRRLIGSLRRKDH